MKIEKNAKAKAERRKKYSDLHPIEQAYWSVLFIVLFVGSIVVASHYV